jgi:hypothetical protein
MSISFLILITSAYVMLDSAVSCVTLGLAVGLNLLNMLNAQPEKLQKHISVALFHVHGMTGIALHADIEM